MNEDDCVFCDLTQFRAADVCIENAYCLYASTRDPRDPPDVLPGCGVIIPIAHRTSPFDYQGGRSAIKVPENRRHDPSRRGGGRAQLFGPPRPSPR
jgi:hypothetical protein